MSARRLALLVLAALALAGCGASSSLPSPAPASVAPGRGFAANATPVLIHGSGFSVRTVQPASGGPPVVDETFQAWLGSDPLQDVRWIDEHTLSATVPAGLAPGSKALRVQGPFGTSGVLADAFTVVGTALASIAATMAAAPAPPATVNVGGSISVTLRVTNTGTTDATDVVPDAPTVTGSGTVGPPSQPALDPAAHLAPGDSVTFTWIYPATGAGSLAFSGGAGATDSFSGTVVRGVTDPASPARATVVLPAALTASLPASGAAALGQEFAVKVTVENTGGADATNVTTSAPAVTPGLATLKPGAPPPLALLAAGASADFTWTFVAGATQGTVTFSSSASGDDANSGDPVTSAVATSGAYTIGAAGIDATLAAAPATATAGQLITLTLTATNPGRADVTSFAVSAPSASSTDLATATLVSGPTTLPPAVLAAGQTFTTTWTFRPGLASGGSGHLTFHVTASGLDAISHGAVSAQPTAPATVQVQAGLDAVLTAARTPPAGLPFTVDTGQPFTLSLAVTNKGAAGAAAVVGVTATPVAGCTAPSPVSATIPPGPAVVFGYATCSSATAGPLVLSASATGTDANDTSLQVASNTASTTVTVQSPPAVTATGLATSPATLTAGQAFTVSLTLAKTGGGAANVTGASLSGITCTTAPATPVNGIGATQVLTWSGCTAPAAPTTLNLAGSATWVDVNTGTARTAGPASAAVPVAAGASVVASGISTTPAGLSTGQVFSITLTLAKSGGAPANVTGLSMDYAASCAVAPVLPANDIAATQTFTWTGCIAPPTQQLLSISGFATWVDANVPLATRTTNPTSTAIGVQSAAAVTATSVVPSQSTVDAGQLFSLTLTVGKTGTAPANLTAVTVTGATCPAIAAVNGVVNGQAIAVPGCTASASGTISTTATWVDVNVGTPQTTAAVTAPITVQTAATVTATSVAPSQATVDVGQVFSLTLRVGKTGTAPANLTAVAVTGATCPAITAVNGVVNGQAIAVPGCTASATGTISATATWVDVNVGTPRTTAAVTAPITVQTAATVTATSVAPSQGTVNAGQAFSLTLTVGKSGTAPANLTAVAVTGASCPAIAAVNGVVNGQAIAVPGCTASATGTISATATWVDVNVGVPQTTAAVTAPITVQTAAGVTATSVAPSQPTVNAGQLFSLTLTVGKSGTAPANLTAVAVTGATCPAIAAVNGVVNGQAIAVPGCTASATGTISATATWVDVNVGTPQVTAAVTTPLTVQTAATVTATSLAPSQPTVNAGQLFSLTLTVGKAGTAPANLTAISVAGATCPAIAAVNGVVNGQAIQVPGCTATASGTLSATATWVDVNVGTPQVTAAVTTPLTVQTAASVIASSLAASPGALTFGQAFTVTLTLTKTGSAAANVTAVSLTGTTCTTPPATPVNAIAPIQVLTWSGCTAPATAQTLTLGGSATWVDANTGAALIAGPATTSVPVGAGASVQATSLSTAPATLSTGQAYSITLTLAKSGGSAANVTALSMDAAVSCAVAPALPANDIAAIQTFTWTGCTAPATPQLLSISGFATWVDANVPLVTQTTGAASVAVTVQAAAALAVSFAAPPPGTVSVGQAVPLTAQVQNTAPAGGAAAIGVTVTPGTTGSASASCTAASPASSPIPAGSTVPFTFTCTPLTTGNLGFKATANGTAANSGAALSAVANTAPPVTVQTAAVVTASAVVPSQATVDAGQLFSLTFTLGKSGAAQASVTAISVTGATCPAIATAVDVVNGQAIQVPGCTASATGTISATATWVDVNVGVPQTTSAVTSPITVQTAAALTATSVAPSQSTVNVGQLFSLTFTVGKSGTAPANVTAVSVTGATCPAIATVNGVVNGQAIAVPGCTASATGTVSASATWVDLNVGTPQTTAAVTTPLTVQTAATVTATSVAPSQATVDAGQLFSLTFTVGKSGTAPANVTAISVSGATCPAIATVIDVVDGQAIQVPGCSATASGTISATATWVDVNVGTPQTTAAVTAPLTVQTAALVTAESLTPLSVPVGTPFTLVLAVARTGEAGAAVEGATLDAATQALCPLYTGPALPAPVAAFPATTSFTWSCTAPALASTGTLSAQVSWIDVNTGLPGAPAGLAVLVDFN